MKVIIGFLSIAIVLQFIGCSKESLKVGDSTENSQMVVDSRDYIYVYKNDTLYMFKDRLAGDDSSRVAFVGVKFSLGEFRKLTINQSITESRQEWRDALKEWQDALNK